MARTPSPRVDVPTREEFDALKAQVDALEDDLAGQSGQINDLEVRVEALEGSTTTPTPPDPEPIPPDPNPGPGTGMQAKRIADVVEAFGVNTFSSMEPDANVWGSWPSDYSPQSVINALTWITGDSGFALPIREYHYKGRESIQQPWLDQIHAAIPNTQVIMCVGANGSTNDVSSMLSIKGVNFYEGLNEPNTNFGSGEVAPDDTLDIQRLLDDQASVDVWGPSIVAGMPGPGGWIEGYCGGTLPALNSSMAWGNAHYYPPHCPDLTGDGTSVTEYTADIARVYGHPVDITEFHPSLYNSAGHGPNDPGWSGERDAYYTLITLLRCAHLGVRLWWYALYDYGQDTYKCGLYPRRHHDDARPAAQALKNLCTFCPDPGDTARTFNPGKLDVQVQGDAHALLAQASSGVFHLFLWRSAPEPGGDPVSVDVRLGSAVTMSMVNLLRGQTAFLDLADHVTLPIDNGVYVLTVTPGVRR